jgi:hypothetical protein
MRGQTTGGSREQNSRALGRVVAAHMGGVATERGYPIGSALSGVRGLVVGPGFEMVPMITLRVKVRAGRSDTLPHGVWEMAGTPKGPRAGSWQPAAGTAGRW